MNDESQCPEPEMVARFVDGSLEAGERKAVVAHLARCERCREAVASTASVIAEVGPETTQVVRPRAPSWRRFALPGLAAVAVLVLAFTMLLSGGEAPGPVRTVELWSAVGGAPGGVALDAYTLWPALRGDHVARRARRDSFRIGALLADLEAGWSTEGDVVEPLRRLLETLDRLPLSGPAVSAYGDLGAGDRTPEVAARAAAEQLVLPLVDVTWFEAGRRAEMTRLLAGRGLDAEWRARFAASVRAAGEGLEGIEATTASELAARIGRAAAADELAAAATEVIGRLGR